MSTATSNIHLHQAPFPSDSRSVTESVGKIESALLSWEHGPYDVVCERNRKAFNHIGNRRFRIICDNYASLYTDNKKKGEKGHILTTVLDIVHSAGGKFMKKKDGKWVELTSVQEREKIGLNLRRAAAASKSKRKSQTADSAINNLEGNQHDVSSSQKIQIFKTKELQVMKRSEKQMIMDVAGASTNVDSLTDTLTARFFEAAFERQDTENRTRVITPPPQSPPPQMTEELFDDLFDIPDIDDVEIDEIFSLASLMDLQQMDDECDTSSECTPLDAGDEDQQAEEDRQLTSVLLDLESQLGNNAADVLASPLLTDIVVTKRRRSFCPHNTSTSISLYGIY